MARPRQRRATTGEPGERDASAAALPFMRGAGAATAEPEPSVEAAIFAATEVLLAETSIAELSVAQILERAGVSRTTFYRYFNSKNLVVSALLAKVEAELVDVMQPWFSRGEEDPESAIRAAIIAVARVWTNHRPVLRASSECWHSDREIGERWMAMMNTFARDIAAQIDRERKRGAAPRGSDSAGIAQLLTWGSERMLYLAGFGLSGDRLELDAVEPIVATWMGAIYGVVVRGKTK